MKPPPILSEKKQRCVKCGKNLPLSAFHHERGRAKPRTDCRKCWNSQKADLVRKHAFYEGVRDVGAGHGVKTPTSVTVTIKRDTPQRRAESKASRLGEPELHIITADEHVPYMDEQKSALVSEFAADTHVAGRHYLGDLVENAPVSRWLIGNVRRQFDAHTFPEQMEAANRYLDSSIAAARKRNPACRVNILEGNHEAWAENHRDQYPMLGDMLDMELAYGCERRKAKYVRFWTRSEAVSIGRLLLTHGRLVRIAHARAHLLKYKMDMLYGHCHDTQRAVEPQWGRRGDPMVAQCIGCLRSLSVDFQRYDYNNWEHAFAAVWAWPNGDFVHQVVSIKDRLGFVGPTNGKNYR